MIIAIDPGKTGHIVALGMINNDAYWLPLKDVMDTNGVLDYRGINNWIHSKNPYLVIMEHIRGHSTLSHTSVFAMGDIFGQLRICIQQFPHHLVYPVTWQKHVHGKLFRAKGMTPKARTLESYKTLYPTDPLPKNKRSGKINKDLLDAFMIGVWGMHQYGGKDARLSWVFKEPASR